MIRDQDVFVWEVVFAYTNDMKSQQLAISFMSSLANKSCKRCYVDEQTRNDMSFDIVQKSRYYHENLQARVDI